MMFSRLLAIPLGVSLFALACASTPDGAPTESSSSEAITACDCFVKYTACFQFSEGDPDCNCAKQLASCAKRCNQKVDSSCTPVAPPPPPPPPPPPQCPTGQVACACDGSPTICVKTCQECDANCPQGLSVCPLPH